jgi:hypothetical protein
LLSDSSRFKSQIVSVIMHALATLKKFLTRGGVFDRERVRTMRKLRIISSQNSHPAVDV